MAICVSSTEAKPIPWWQSSLERRASYCCVAYALIFVALWGIFCLLNGDSRKTQKGPGLHTFKRTGVQMPLRFAMVHDVIHQRFRKHGESWYKEKLRINLELLEQHKRDGLKHGYTSLHLFDNIAVTYERLHQSERGLEYIEAKRQALLDEFGEEPKPFRPLDIAWHLFAQERYADDSYTLSEALFELINYEPSELSLAWYRYYANKGTILVHAYMKKAMQGDAAAKEKVKEAAELIKKSLCHNPNAHFGREWFQLFAIQNLLVFLDKPKALYLNSIIGHSLGEFQSDEYYGAERHTHFYDQIPKDPNDSFILMHIPTINLFVDGIIGDYNDDNEYVEEAKLIFGFDELSAPFDEPVLGIIGMWVYGGGANPHFALALGDIMEGFGQKRIAWSAYRRAVSMAKRFWPDQEIADNLKQHCEMRMRALEKHMRPDIVAKLEDAYLYELQRGIDYQAAQAAYEHEQIELGKDIHDPSFFEAFNQTHGSIASKIGNSDQLTVRYFVPWDQLFWRYCLVAAFFGSLFGLGMFTWLTKRKPEAVD